VATLKPRLEPAPLPAVKALVRRLVEEGVNQGRLEVVDQVLAPSYPSMWHDLRFDWQVPVAG
jgi:hypothetical protein